MIELIAAYFKHVQAYYGKSSEQTHRSRRILKLLRQYYGDIPTDDSLATFLNLVTVDPHVRGPDRSSTD